MKDSHRLENNGRGKSTALRLSLGALLVVALGSLVSVADDKAKKCPISGKPADSSIALRVNGEEVPFCCKGCPKAYLKKINLVAGEGEKTCPLSGKPASADHTVIQKVVQKIAFCCNNCAASFAKKNKFEIKDAEPGKCPISGGKAKDEEGTSLKVNGNQVFFCCANCPKAYVKKLGAQDISAKCPISGKDSNPETAQYFVKSEEIGFCCGNCEKKYISKNFADGKYIGFKKEEEATKEPEKELPRTRL